jgi:hypothetical protein
MNKFIHVVFTLFNLFLLIDKTIYVYSKNIESSMKSKPRTTTNITNKQINHKFFNSSIKNLKRNLNHNELPPGPTTVYDSMNVI